MPACLNAPAEIPRHRQTLGPLVSDIVSLLDGEFSKCGEIGVSAVPLRCVCQRCPKSKHDAWARNYLQTLYTRAANRVSRVAQTKAATRFRACTTPTVLHSASCSPFELTTLQQHPGKLQVGFATNRIFAAAGVPLVARQRFRNAPLGSRANLRRSSGEVEMNADDASRRSRR